MASEQAIANRKEYMRKYKHTEQYKEYKKKNIEKYKACIRAANIKKHKAVRLAVLTHYSGGKSKCACCGEENIEFLQLDHINNDGAEHRKSTSHLYSWIIKNNFPEGFRILCANCNFSRGAYGYCPHRNLPEDIKT